MNAQEKVYVTVNPNFERYKTRLLSKFIEIVGLFEGVGVLPNEAQDLVLNPQTGNEVFVLCDRAYLDVLRRLHHDTNFKISVPGMRGDRKFYLFEVFDIND